MTVLDTLTLPVVGAPMAGGPSTPALAAAVTRAGGLGFLAAGYRTVDDVAVQLADARGQVGGPVGLNVFVPGMVRADPAQLAAYAARVRAWADARGLPVGEPRHDDDAWEGKLALACAQRPAVVSFTFGCPSSAVLKRLRDAGVETWVTVTSVAEARQAAAAGADALVVQGAEAGGHQGSFADGDDEPLGLLALLALVRRAVDVPLIAAGGIVDGRGLAAVLAAGAAAAQVGTALLRSPEAGTSAVHRAALAQGGPTSLTRAWSGRRARGIVNAFQVEHSPHAPRAYPELHHLTTPLRAHGRSTGDADLVSLWAGQGFPLAREAPAAAIVREMCAEAATLLHEARTRVR